MVDQVPLALLVLKDAMEHPETTDPPETTEALDPRAILVSLMLIQLFKVIFIDCYPKPNS